MKAISLKQPWASMIASGEKTIETRTWSTPYRGDILIVASKSPVVEIAGNVLPTGAAVAVARIVDCRPMTRADQAAACCEIYDGAWAWILEDIRLITPFAVRGQLGIYDVDVPEGAL